MKSYSDAGIIPNVGDMVFVLAPGATLKPTWRSGRPCERTNSKGNIGFVKQVANTFPPKVLVDIPVPVEMQKAFGKSHTSEWRTTDTIGVLK